MDRNQFLEQFNSEARRERSPQHRAALIKGANKRTKESIEQRERFARKRRLQASRRNLSFAQGLKTCRELRDMTRSEFADAMGITRRALYNYETGQRSVPGDLIEKIAKEGDLDLHEVFGTTFERAPVERRKSDAVLAIQIYVSLKQQFSTADDSVVSHITAEDADIQRKAGEAAATWPTNIKITEKSISNVTKRLAEQLADDYAVLAVADSQDPENDSF
jgi:transcriptional regulator with XRE-family HTH domain